MKKSSFVEGTFIATLAIVITKILGMLYVIPFYAMIGKTGGALYSAAYTIYIIFLDISSAGLPIAMSKIISEYNALGMNDAKVRAYRIGKRIMVFLAVIIFFVLFIFAPQIANLMFGGDLAKGLTINDVSMAIRAVSFSILVVPFLSVTKGYLQGHKVIGTASLSQVIEQIVRIAVVLGGSYLVLYVLNKGVTLAVCVSVFGAFVGGLAAYLYIKYKMYKSSDPALAIKDVAEKDKVSNKEIVKKIITYAIPFIIINVVSSCYNFVDMTLLIRTMRHLQLNPDLISFAYSAVTTWAPKINMIVTSIAMGMSTSFIPTMVTAYTLNNWKEVNNKFNQALQMLLFISIPMTVGLSLLSSSVWTIFYGYEKAGTIILALNVFTGLFINIYMIASSALQGLNKFKIVYLSAIVGFASNAALDIPLMLLYNKIGIPSYLGAVTASIIGYTLSIIIALISLRKECNLAYGKTFKTLGKMIIPTIIMIVVVVLCKMVVPVNYGSRLSCVLYVAVNALVGGIVYLAITWKSGLIEEVLGKSTFNKILKKISFGKIKIKEDKV